MDVAAGTPLDLERYVNLETFRRDGSGVKTPVWTAPLDGCLVIVTDGASYKVKRLRRNPACRIAACNARGAVRGPWYEGTCRILDDPEHVLRAHGAMRAKYRWQMGILDLFARLGRRIGRRAWLEVTLRQPVG